MRDEALRSIKLKYHFSEKLSEQSRRRREFFSLSLFGLLFVTTKSDKRNTERRNFNEFALSGGVGQFIIDGIFITFTANQSALWLTNVKL